MREVMLAVSNKNIFMDLSLFQVGLVTDSAPVPAKDKLTLLTVDVGETMLQIVTNSSNLRVGNKTIVARIGAEVGGETVRQCKVGGIDSHGMICDSFMVGWKGGWFSLQWLTCRR